MQSLSYANSTLSGAGAKNNCIIFTMTTLLAGSSHDLLHP